jgi:outer membrane protein OmpA-like peptidoglycan-associated protein
MLRKIPMLLAAPAAGAAALLLAGQAAAQPLTLDGIISQRTGGQVTVTSPGGGSTVLTLTPSTRAVATSGKVFANKEERDLGELIKGLPVTVEANRDGDVVEALKFTYKSKDLKTAQQVQAGTSELQSQNDDLRRRLSQAHEYVLKDEATVLFATGSATISSEGKAALKRIAAKAKAIDGYFIGVVGHADPRGSVEANQRLSARRALAVTAYLQQYCGVMPSRVLAPDAMGEALITGDASSTEGLAQNRKVVVKVLTNKGLEGLTPPPST